MSDYFANIDMMQAWTVLITGFVVVFAVLLLLIVIIKIYSTIVYNIQNKPKKEKKNDDDTPKGGAVTTSNAPAATSSNGIPNDVLAAIAAAVEFVFGSKNVRIKNIRKSKSRSSWGSAGVKTNTRPF